MMLDEILPERRFCFTIIGSPSPIHVQSFTADERVSECFLVRLSLVSERPISPCDVIQREALLTLEGSRSFHGILNKFSLTGRQGRFYLYRATLVPSVWFLSLNKDFRVFQDKTVVEIVDEVLSTRMPNQRYELRLMHKYEEKRRYCTQFGESDLAFISRLLEEEGIFYFFDHFQDRHLLVLADEKVAYASIVGEGKLLYNPGDGMIADTEVITSFVFSRCVRAGKVTYVNYNFKRPSLDLTIAQRGNREEPEVYDYPGDYGHPARGRRLANIRLEEKKTLEEFAEGASNCQRLSTGHTFTLAGHDFDSLNKSYLLVTVTHSGSQSHVVGEESGIGGDCSYFNEFLAIPAEVNLRPERTFAKPIVAGLQSAVVVGPPGEEIHPDQYGRVKVQFHWDREGQRTEKSSCWLRLCQPWSGQGWGMMSIPRVGDEVLVAFMNGDPDWPVVVGSVNNALSPALYALPEKKTQSGIRTRSYPDGSRDNFHELRFEDRKGSEEIYLQSERDWNILVKNDKGQVVGNDETLLVKNDRKKTVQMNQTESIGVNKTIEVGAEHLERIGASMTRAVAANKSDNVGGNSAESVGLAKELTIGGLYQVSVGGVMNETVAGAKTEEVGMAKAVVVGADMAEQVIGSRQLKVGSHFQIDAGESFEVKCGSSVLRMNSDGSLFMNGTRLELGAAGVVKVTGEDIQLN